MYSMQAGHHPSPAAAVTAVMQERKDHKNNEDVQDSASSQANRSSIASISRIESVALKKTRRSVKTGRSVLPKYAGSTVTRLEAAKGNRWSAVKKKTLVAALLSQYAIHRKQHQEIMRLRGILEEKERLVRGLTVQQARWVLEDSAPAGEFTVGETKEKDLDVEETGLTGGQPGSANRSRKAVTTNASGQHSSELFDMALIYENIQDDKSHKNAGGRPRSESGLEILLQEYQRNLQILNESRHFLSQQLDVNMSDMPRSMMALSDTSSLRSVSCVSDVSTEPDSKHDESESTADTLINRNSGIQEDYKINKDQVDDMKKIKDRLEKSLRAAKDREEKLRSQLHKLNESKLRTEKRLQEAVDGKDNLENEVKSLSTLNGRLARLLHEHHGTTGVDADNTSSERVQLLEAERDELREQLEKAKTDITSLQQLDSKRKDQLNDMMRQAASVENHLLTALDRLESLSDDYVHRGGNRSSIDGSQASKRPSMMAHVPTQEEQSRIKVLEDREVELLKEIAGLTTTNKNLEKELENARAELNSLKNSMQQLSNELDLTKDQSSSIRQNAEQTHQYNQVLEESLANMQKENNRSNQRLKFLSVKLVAASKENKKLVTQYVRAESSLDVALEENARLTRLMENTSGSLKVTEASVASLNIEFKTFVQESEDKMQHLEGERQMLIENRDQLEDRLGLYEQETRQLVEISLSLQHVLQGLENSKISPTSDSSPKSSRRRSNLSAISRSPTIQEGGDLASELGILQENMIKLHGVLSRLRMRNGLSAMRGHTKQDSGIDLQNNSPRLSMHFSRPLTESVRKSAVNFSRLSIRDSAYMSSRDGSPLSMQQAKIRSAHRTTSSVSSWHSTESSLQNNSSNVAPSLRRGFSFDQGNEEHDTIDGIAEEDDEDFGEIETAIAVCTTPSPPRRVSVQSRTGARGGSVDSAKYRFKSDPNLRKTYDDAAGPTSVSRTLSIVDLKFNNGLRKTSSKSMENLHRRMSMAVCHEMSSPTQLAEFTFTASESHDLETSPPQDALDDDGMGPAKLRKIGISIDQGSASNKQLSRLPSRPTTANDNLLDFETSDARKRISNPRLGMEVDQKITPLPEVPQKKTATAAEKKKNRRTMLFGSTKRNEETSNGTPVVKKSFLDRLLGR